MHLAPPYTSDAFSDSNKRLDSTTYFESELVTSLEIHSLLLQSGLFDLLLEVR